MSAAQFASVPSLPAYVRVASSYTLPKKAQVASQVPPSAPKYQQTPGNSMSPMQGNVVLVDVVLVVEVVVLVDSVVLVLLLVDVVVLVVVVGGNALAMVIAQLSTSDWELAPSQ